MERPGPLLLAPERLPKVWAGPELPPPWGGLWPSSAGIGEFWLASDRHSQTRVAAGPLDGLELGEVVKLWPQWLLGPGAGGGLPILLKILNVGDWLSVQVHPDDATAAHLEGEPWGKSEAWHVLWAAPGAQIVMGLVPGAGRQEVRRALVGGGLTGLLARVPARAGDTFHLPAGTLHATGPGLVICELQQASDVTYRLHDWDRLGDDGHPRPLHQDKALEALKPSGPGQPQAPVLLEDGPNRRERLVEDPHFALLRCRLAAPYAPA